MIRRGPIVAAALGLVLLVAVALELLGVDWKALIGWRALVDYINPKNATGRKDAVQVYALIAAGVVAAITAAVGLSNLRLTRKNLEQQRELEAQRAEQQRELAQGTALQAYYEQIGNLITDKDLLNTERKEIRELARGQTLTVLQEVDGNGKGSLLTFLHGAGLIKTGNPAVALTGADLQGVALGSADLRGANLQGANLGLRVFSIRPEANFPTVNFQGALLQGANLREVELQYANLDEADLRGADLQGAALGGASLRYANLQGTNLLGASGITEDQIEWTLGSNETQLPQDLNPPRLWSESVEEQLRFGRGWARALITESKRKKYK